ncbi:MAG: response regulator transcription factor [Ruminococcaceae bacterium]|nr:response regulator transcription factor [Oscillospiraceae bacterium]
MPLRTKILIADEDKNINNFIKSILESNGFAVIQAYSGAEAFSMLTSHCPDLMVINLGLPDTDGFSVIKSVRQWSRIPIIVLTSHSNESHIVESFDAGADDFIRKPFGTGELIARINNALRHADQLKMIPEISFTKKFTVRDLVVDFDKHAAFIRGKEANLTHNEFRIVALLAMHAGKVLTYDYILKKLWGPASDENNRILRVNMSNIRKKIEEVPASPEYIFTERRMGFRMADE